MIKRLVNKFNYLNDIRQRAALNKDFCKGHQVRLWNWSRPYDPDRWLIDFIEKRGLLTSKPKAKIALYSIFGPSWMMRFDNADARIFVERENLHKPHMQGWLHRYLDDERIDLSLGFDELEHQQYMHFPFWVMWDVFSPTATYEEIKREVKRMNSIENSSYDDRKYCTYICSHDDIGRRKIYDQFSTIGHIDCGGKLFHNDDDLKLKFGDDKLAYLRHYRFNLTPENTNHENYVTEKLFEAISSGCIPIYHGSDNNPEPNVLNQDAIIFMEVGADNSDALKLVEELNSNKAKYLEFARQPRFVVGAEDVIWYYYQLLESKITDIINTI